MLASISSAKGERSGQSLHVLRSSSATNSGSHSQLVRSSVPRELGAKSAQGRQAAEPLSGAKETVRQGAHSAWPVCALNLPGRQERQKVEPVWFW